MNAKIQHPIFADSPHDDTVLWRYMGIDGFQKFLELGSLRFTRIDRFDDHFEGVWPLEDMKAWDRMGALSLVAGVAHNMKRSSVAASCWIALPHESAGMWRLYASGSHDKCVAMRTTFGKLRALTESVEDTIPGATAGAARVRYIDHVTDSLIAPLGRDEPLPNALQPFMLKHQSYRHEEEVRALIVAPHGQEIDPAGLQLPIPDMTAFVDQIVVNPLSDTAFEEQIVRLAKTRDLHEKAIRSALHRRRFYFSVSEADTDKKPDT